MASAQSKEGTGEIQHPISGQISSQNTDQISQKKQRLLSETTENSPDPQKDSTQLPTEENQSLVSAKIRSNENPEPSTEFDPSTLQTGDEELSQPTSKDGGALPEVQTKSARSPASEVSTFKGRWLILLIFSLFSLGSAYQWIHLNIIANIMTRYYNDSLPQDSLQKATAVDWLSMVYFLSYFVTFLPVLWLLDAKGLRIHILIGTTLNVVGTWLKVAAVNSDLFPLMLGAQTLCGLAEVFVLPVPPRLAAVWFGPGQVSTACSLGVLANQFGVAIGFLVPPVLVPDALSLDEVGSYLRYMLIGGAVYSTIVLLLVVFAFRDKPPCPPSQAQFLVESQLSSVKRSDDGFFHSLLVYRDSLLRLLRNRNFLLLMISYGLNVGSYYAISTLLNNMVLSSHPGEQRGAGRIGLTIVFAGVLASLLAGVWLDKTKAFKSTSIAIYAFAVIGMVAFTLTLDLELWVIYLTAGALGFFMTGYLPVGYQFAAEITYPEPEGSSSGLLTASAMSLGIVMTLGMRAMMNQISIFAANLFVSSTLLLGTVMTVAIRAKYLRQEAENSVRHGTHELTITETDS